jgi:hypothetical protein
MMITITFYQSTTDEPIPIRVYRELITDDMSYDYFSIDVTPSPGKRVIK